MCIFIGFMQRSLSFRMKIAQVRQPYNSMCHMPQVYEPFSFLLPTNKRVWLIFLYMEELFQLPNLESTTGNDPDHSTWLKGYQGNRAKIDFYA